MKKTSERWLSDYQKVILSIMLDRERRFLREIVVISGLVKKSLDRNLRFLCRRGLMDIQREVDITFENKRICNKYFITKKGIEVFEFNHKHNPFEVTELIKDIKNNKIENLNTKKRNKSFVGKNQKLLLNLLNEKG